MHRDFFSLSKHPSINKSIGLPKESDTNAANTMVTIVIIGGKKINLILWPKKSDTRLTSILGWKPWCRFTCLCRYDFP